MAIVLDVLVAGVVAGGVAGGVVLAARPRLARGSHDPLPAGSGASSSANGGPASAPARSVRAEEAAAGGGAARGEETAAASARGERALAAGHDGERARPAAAAARATAAVATPGGGPSRAAGTGGRPQPVRTARAAEEAPARSGGGPTPGGDGAAPVTAAAREEIAAELRERRAEIARIEERLLTKEAALEGRLEDSARKERSLADRSRNLDAESEKLKTAKREHVRELERIASLSAAQARQILLRELEDELRSDSARLVRQVEEEARREADRRARSILATVMQRLAGGHAVETTVSTVALQSDDLKGRIIGREGRNIRTLEMLTGIDFIVDDTPGAVILSGFDGVRREIARLTLEKLLADGRIHPARIEEAYYAARSEIENRIMEVGEQAVLEANVGTLHPELTKLLGRLHYRTSYGQNVLAHSIECANLANMLASELGASQRTAARAALLHDIGKAVTHEVEGPHALVGGELARRHNETEAVAHAMEAHHNEVSLQTIEAVIVQIADSLSGARPGARGASLENYTKRLRELEEIAKRHDGVEKVYAMQAGREIRVIVQPEEVDDDAAALLSHRIARDLEKELEYAGQIKVTVIRESRSVDFAK